MLSSGFLDGIKGRNGLFLEEGIVLFEFGGKSREWYFQVIYADSFCSSPVFKLLKIIRRRLIASQ